MPRAITDALGGYTSKNYKGVPIAVEHHSDGSVTVCREVAEAIAADKRVPKRIRKHFQPQRSVVDMLADNFIEFQLRMDALRRRAKDKR